MKKISALTFASVLGLVMAAICSTAVLAMPLGDFRGLAKEAGPAVVNINTERTEQVRAVPPGFDFFEGIPEMDRFFEGFEHFQGGPRTRKSSSLGSGFIISSDGYIVTNNHVIEGADSIRVSMGRGGKENIYAAKVIGTDPATDLALIKVEASDLPYLEFGDSDALEVGEWVLAIGSPLGLDHTVTAGIISAKGRSIQSGPYDDFLQTDASINQGNSGGPLLNMQGQVIGINTAIAQRAQGIGFAIPSSLAQKTIGSLREHSRVSRGWLGVTIQNVDEATAKALGLENVSGVLVSSALEGQPAEKAGIRSGDVILAIDGKQIEDTKQLLRVVADILPGTTVNVDIWRESKKQSLSLVVAERDAPQAANGQQQEAPKSDVQNTLGLTLRPVSEGDLRRYNLSEQDGLLITGVAEGGLSAKAGIRPGDVLLAVNGVRVNSQDELSAQVAQGIKERGALLMQISRRGQLFFKAVEIKE